LERSRAIWPTEGIAEIQNKEAGAGARIRKRSQFRDLVDGAEQDRIGYTKIRFCAEQGRHDGLHYFWVDICCIDKLNNNELSTAINSMFR